MTALVVAPGTPYITPAVLLSAPTGISWSTVPGRNTEPSRQNAEQLNICARATAMVDGYCNQPLRATVDTETLSGPGTFRMQIQPSGVARLLLSRSPVTQVVSGQVTSAAAFPPSWAAIPANNFRPEKPMLGVYGTSAPASAAEGGQAVLLAPGWVTWAAGRATSEVQVTYINGWPHGSLTGAVAAGASSLPVDDITGWFGAAGTVHDVGQQETISVTAVAPSIAGAISGPGTLTLASALAYAHAAGVMVTTLPGTVIWAAILFAVSQALTRGATATTVQSQPGSRGGGGRDPAEVATEAELMIHPFRRVL
jgi:hypothetical protein